MVRDKQGLIYSGVRLVYFREGKYFLVQFSNWSIFSEARLIFFKMYQ